MSDSLKNQLIALGLVPKQPAQRRSRKPRKTAVGSATRSKEDISLEEAFRRRQQAEKQQAEEARRRKQAEDQRRRRINGEVEALVTGQARNDPAAEFKRNFLYKGRIRSVPVTGDQLRALNAGELAVVFLKGRYLLVDTGVAERVRAVSAEHVPDLAGGTGDDGPSGEEGDHPVPDDLVW